MLPALSWAAVAAIGLAASLWWIFLAARQHRFGVDVIAVLALAGSLVLGEYLAGALIGLMLASGRVLEARASTRARRELSSLVARAPRFVHLHGANGVETADVDVVERGDVVVVEPGEVVPVDGVVVDGVSILDESALTGEPLPVEHPAGDPVRSGVINAGGPFDLHATTTSTDSTYAGIVRLVEDAQAAAPFVRLADRYALFFVVVSIAAAGLAWLLSGDAIRAVAVLVVATPCPLILAAPVAIVSGLSRAARRGVLIKSGAVLERLADGKILLFDKTGTLTSGRPTVTAVTAASDTDEDEVLRLAASIDQLSPHVLAAAVVRAARDRGLALSLPANVVETPGRGVSGTLEGRDVVVGSLKWVAPEKTPWLAAVRRRSELDGALTVAVGVDGAAAGAIVLEDPIRPDAVRTIRKLRHDGIDRVVMVTGDRADVAITVGAVIGVDEVLAERTPSDKVDAIRAESRNGPTIMVGDGINDAPALAAADVGVAIGARGATASSEAADVVLTADRLDRLGDGIAIARHARDIARQSVLAGIGLSLVAMAAAAAGLIPPAWGALLQEAIDVAVIVNALRVLRPHQTGPQLEVRDAELVEDFRRAHEILRPNLDRVRRAADQIGEIDDVDAVSAVRDVQRFLTDEIAPHEESEDAVMYPVFARVLGGEDPTATMSRAHLEIAHLIRRLGILLDQTDPTAPGRDDLHEMRRILYGLHAILVLHFAQEDESYLSLVDEPGPVRETPARGPRDEGGRDGRGARSR